jgi:hypothetical protein
MRSYQDIIEWLALNLEESEIDEATNNGVYCPLIVFASFVADVDEADLFKDLRSYMDTEGIV